MAESDVVNLLKKNVTSLPPISDPSFGNKFNDFGKYKVIILGSASHGTSEFYTARARITQHLIENHGFNIVAAEADWPDAESIDFHIRRRLGTKSGTKTPFDRFPRWVWRNAEFNDFVDWLRQHNKNRPVQELAGFYGLDIFSMGTSMEAVINYLANHALDNPELAKEARERYAKVQPWLKHMGENRAETISAMSKASLPEVVSLLNSLLKKRLDNGKHDNYTEKEEFFSGEQNAQLVADADRFYKAMYQDNDLAASWNLRASHMIQTLSRILAHRGDEAKAVVWAHNGHAGDMRAMTNNWQRGDLNLGRLARETFGKDVAIIGCGTHTGTVAGAKEWGGDMEYLKIPPSISGSFEALAHQTGIPSFFLDLRAEKCDGQLLEHLGMRKERYIGIIYDPDETEPEAEYADAIIGQQFDGYIWLDETMALKPLEVHQPQTALPLTETFPWGL